MEKVDLQQWKKNAICDILESSNTYEKVLKFEKYRSFLGKCKIFLFDEDESNVDNSFKNYEIGKCGIYGLGDYTKTWIMDTCYKSNIRYVAYGKTVDFDLNVFTYLNKIMNGRNLSQGIDKRDVINYFNYIKVNEFQYGIATAMMERAAKPINSKDLIEMLVSYVKYEKINYIDERVKRVHLNIFDYMRVLKLYRMTWKQYNLEIRQFDMLCCCLMKAYLIKKYDSEKSKKKKIEKFIYYCLRTLNCYSEKEVVLLALYIADDERTKETFKKLDRKSKVEENILSVAWDLYHIRLIEQIMCSDNAGNKEQVILSYFATADTGLKDAMKINPLKAFVILDDYPIAFHSIRLKDVCKNEEIINEVAIMAAKRKENIENTDFAEIKRRLLEEINKVTP